MHLEHDQAETTPERERRGVRRLLPRRGTGRTRAVLVGAGVLAFGIAPLTYAATGGNLILGERNASTDETEVIATTDAGPGQKGGYSTRQSNLSTTGGGAIYGCRSTARTAPNDLKNPCLRANNLSTGLAFEFRATRGTLGGDISVANGGDQTRPFTTNATGVATGLNADRVDGLHAEDLAKGAAAIAAKEASEQAAAAKSRWALVNEKGEIEEQSGGFKVIDCYGTNDNCYLDAGSTVAGHGITATIALQNEVDVDGTAGADPSFSGEISAARCQVANVVTCAPDGAKTENALVVSPRNSDGSATTDGARKRFYVELTG
ncbi:hypothetical protein SK069_03620 [Patulibacter brassicae]|uniref:Uncharacterized protein n=1 Tax=Patulibacter brassicae TaxID=1705717 RepID=A0ABU4VFS1_9ACTN|nr:hypothetical protein [Patulibacter brassicae]MDX8150671.1 hypothetical protein [Patulibacter brassicae]